jgi:hypothetical protein
MNQNLVVIMVIGEDQEKDKPATLNRTSRYLKVKNLKEASAGCKAYIQENNLPETNWVGGYVFAGSRQVAMVEFSGRILKEGERGYHSFFSLR